MLVSCYNAQTAEVKRLGPLEQTTRWFALNDLAIRIKSPSDIKAKD